VFVIESSLIQSNFTPVVLWVLKFDDSMWLSFIDNIILTKALHGVAIFKSVNIVSNIGINLLHLYENFKWVNLLSVLLWYPINTLVEISNGRLMLEIWLESIKVSSHDFIVKLWSISLNSHINVFLIEWLKHRKFDCVCFPLIVEHHIFDFIYLVQFFISH